jgi:hypothetical protein
MDRGDPLSSLGLVVAMLGDQRSSSPKLPAPPPDRGTPVQLAMSGMNSSQPGCSSWLVAATVCR